VQRSGQLWFTTRPLDGPLPYDVLLSPYVEFWRAGARAGGIDYLLCHFTRTITISAAVPDGQLDAVAARAIAEAAATAPGFFNRQIPPEGHCVWIASRWWPLARQSCRACP